MGMTMQLWMHTSNINPKPRGKREAFQGQVSDWRRQDIKRVSR